MAVKSRDGFTLIEIAILLVIIGLLVGMGAGMLRFLIPREKSMETRNTLKTIDEAIIGFVMKNKRLPSNLTVLGTKTLDAYMEEVEYNVTSILTSPTTNICNLPPSLSTHYYLTVNDQGKMKYEVAYLIMSKGANHCDQTSDPTHSNYFHIYSPGVEASCPSNPHASYEYDDQVIYRDINSLEGMVCSGDEKFRIITRSLPDCIINHSYIAYIYTENGDKLNNCVVSDSHFHCSVHSDGKVKITSANTTSSQYYFSVSVTDIYNRNATKSFHITCY